VHPTASTAPEALHRDRTSANRRSTLPTRTTNSWSESRRGVSIRPGATQPGTATRLWASIV